MRRVVESRHDGVAWKLLGRPNRCRRDAFAGSAARSRQRRAGRPRMISLRRCDADDFTAARACGLYEGVLRASVWA
jgi:hypothetical protein